MLTTKSDPRQTLVVPAQVGLPGKEVGGKEVGGGVAGQRGDAVVDRAGDLQSSENETTKDRKTALKTGGGNSPSRSRTRLETFWRQGYCSRSSALPFSRRKNS